MANIKQVNINNTLYDIEALKATQDGSGNVITSTYATKAVATADVAGLMSAADKGKLDSILLNNLIDLDKRGTEIVAGTDLNDLLTPGCYYSSSASRTQELINVPYTAGGFRLFVFNSHNNLAKIQFVIGFGDHLFYRFYQATSSGEDNPSWRNWVNLISSANDTKVTQEAAITTAGEYPVILGKNTSTTEVTDSVNKTSTLKYNPSTEVLTAPTFKGGLTTDGGNIILKSENNYSTSLPSSASEGQLFFAEEDYLELPTGGSVDQVLVKNSAGNGDAKWSTNIAGNAGTATKLATAQTITLTGDVTGSASFTGNTACSITTTVANASHTHTWSNISDRASCTIKTSGTITGSKVYGAVWNDYAEFRICNDNFIPGQVVCENGDDTLSISTRRMQPGANIVSDTFGFAIGKTENAKCPIAVSGRVLAYTYEPREDFKPGEAVCAGPNGTISRMTREEIREYPECIIGTVSAIPEYDSWGENNTLVNNRIWIKI